MEFSGNVTQREGGAGVEQQDGLNEVLSVLRRRRHLIMAAIGATLLIALIYLMLASTRYTATTVVVLDTKPSALLLQSETFVEPQVDEAAVESHVQTIKSENVAKIVVKKLGLADDPEFAGIMSVLQKWFGKWLGTSAADETAGSDEETLRPALEEFAKGLRVTRISRSYAVEIAYSSLDPRKAAVIANAVADAYIEDQLQAKFEVAKRASQWLRQRIAELRDQATNAFKGVQDFKSQNNLIVSSDGELSTDLELQQLTEALAKARAETAQAQSRLADIEAILSAQNKGDGFPEGVVTDALSSPVIIKFRQKYLDDMKQEVEWASRYGANHQAVINLRTEMVGLKRGIREEMARIAETYKSDLIVARSREDSIEKRVMEVFQNNGKNRQSQVKLQELQTASNTYRATYENFLNRYTQVVQQQSFPSTEARIITFASIGKKTSPKIVLTLALAIIGGVGLGTAAAFMREQLDRVVYARDQLVRKLGVNCICALPAARRSGEEPRPAFPSEVMSWFGVREPTILLKQWKAVPAKQDRAAPPTQLFSEEDPFSMTSEALRNIKVAMDLRSISRETRTVAIVSALSGEGKSSVAVSLAATIAKAGRKVLLIDCDLRNSSLTTFLGLKNRAGVVELLNGETEVTTYNSRYGFEFLCGSTRVRPVHTADILNSQAMWTLLEYAKGRYDHVLVDLPPILPVVDVRACARLIDSFALVVEWGKTSIDDLDKAFHIAPLVRERLLGIILNKVDAAAMERIDGYGHVANGCYV